ncbi:hypothetical protein ACFQY0_10995 [Haloferula chungangensis]|uniref:PEP-CTERM sorting domain-containing protein n=1 Tax=Haloferula chungangensis TaxID=1048331 RepID=A0ABW2L819_9BACT
MSSPILPLVALLSISTTEAAIISVPPVDPSPFGISSGDVSVAPPASLGVEIVIDGAAYSTTETNWGTSAGGTIGIGATVQTTEFGIPSTATIQAQINARTSISSSPSDTAVKFESITSVTAGAGIQVSVGAGIAQSQSWTASVNLGTSGFEADTTYRLSFDFTRFDSGLINLLSPTTFDIMIGSTGVGAFSTSLTSTGGVDGIFDLLTFDSNSGVVSMLFTTGSVAPEENVNLTFAASALLSLPVTTEFLNGSTVAYEMKGFQISEVPEAGNFVTTGLLLAGALCGVRRRV